MRVRTKLSSAQRENQIRQLLHQQCEVSIGPLAEMFSVSAMTIRRDLRSLERRLRRLLAAARADRRSDPRRLVPHRRPGRLGRDRQHPHRRPPEGRDHLGR